MTETPSLDPSAVHRLRARLDDDFTTGLQRLYNAQDQDEARRTLSSLLGTLYTWRELERKRLAVDRAGFAEWSGQGERFEILIQWRNVETHEATLLIDMAPETHHLFSGPHLMSGPHLLTGSQPHFRLLSEGELSALPKRMKKFYPRLNGMPIGALVGDAGDFLRGLANVPPNGSAN